MNISEWTKNEIGIALERLINGKPLTPIEDTPDAWDDSVKGRHGFTTYQCKRMSSLFKDVYEDGTIEYYDIDRFLCINKDDPNACGWHNELINRILHIFFPITMPYYPPSKPWYVYCTERLSNPKNGDFDTIGIWYIVKPNREYIKIERFFKECGDSWTEIDRNEYENRARKGEHK